MGPMVALKIPRNAPKTPEHHTKPTTIRLNIGADEFLGKKKAGNARLFQNVQFLLDHRIQ